MRMNTRQLQEHCPYAFAALPTCYQNDDCLVFWEVGSRLYAKPAKGQEGSLGVWQAEYHPPTYTWRRLQHKDKE